MLIHSRFIPILVGTFALVGCDAAATGAPSASAAASAAAPASAAPSTQKLVAVQAPASTAPTSAAPAGGETKLTKTQLEDAKKQVRPFMPFKDAGTKLFTALGPPHGKNGDTIFWRSEDGGGKCTTLNVEKKGEEVGAVGLMGGDCK
jgi:hypothetical protein